MGRFDKIVICTDLDGTLLRDDRSLSKENVDAIEYFKSEGGHFTFVTGRMPFYCGKIIDLIKPNAPFGCINGGGLYDHVENKYIYTVPLDSEALELVRYADKLLPGIGIQLNTFDTVYFARESSAMEIFRRLTGSRNIVRDYEGFDLPMSKVVFGDEDEERIDRLSKILYSHPLAEKYDFIRSEKTLYEILPKGVHKGTVLPLLVERLNTDMAHCIAVGDFENDIGMIVAAGIGIAVSNARDAVKAVADRITVSNEEHAIAQIIRDIESGEITF